MTFSVTVRDHLMIAHSLRGDVFGPAQQLHGATYLVDATFRAAALDDDGVVVDIGRAGDLVRRIVGELTYRNLDDVPGLLHRNTTTEVLARVVFDGLVAAIGGGALGPGGTAIERIRVTLHESHVASASFEARVDGAS